MASQMIGAGFEPYPGWRDWLAEQKSCAHARLDALLGYPELRRRYQQKTGYPLNLDAPLTVGDKINWRKIRDRNPAFPVLADKVRVRDHVAARLGKQAAEGLFPAIYLVTDRAAKPQSGAAARQRRDQGEPRQRVGISSCAKARRWTTTGCAGYAATGCGGPMRR